MCGITGEVNYYGLPRRQSEQVLDAMNATMADRGPDGEGSWFSEYAMLGHRRLAIIDLEGGSQPMVRETALGTVALTYGGEVYNYQELRDDLRAKGHEFRTRSDTEVILNGYLEHGEDLPEMLRGMFAIAIWDGRAGADKLTLIRDHIGIKPLCYQPTPHGVIFGSEPKAILAHPDADRSVGLSEWQNHFASTKIPDQLMWSSMKEVKPGEMVVVNRNGIHSRTYWHLQTQPHIDDYSSTVENARGMLEEIVGEQMVADVPLGGLLSGGLDSSGITALAADYRRARGKTFDTYIVDFEGGTQPRADLLHTGWDVPFAEEVAVHLHTNHTRFVLNAVELASRELRERVVRARELLVPAARDGNASHLLLYEGLRQQSTAVLSGEMADEIFGGYVIFHESKVLNGKGWPWQLRGVDARIKELAMFTPEFRDALDLNTYLADTYADAIKPVERLEDESDLDYRLRVITYLEATRHVALLLDATDRLSGAVGLEVRVPFCDHRLVQYVYNVPWKFRKPDGRAKGLLSDAFSGMLPQSILRRPKSPYPLIPNPRYSAELQRQVKELLSRPSRTVFDIFSREWLGRTSQKPADSLNYAEDAGMNHALEVDIWFDMHRPALTL